MESKTEHNDRSPFASSGGWAKLALTFFRTCMFCGGVLYLAYAETVKSPFHALLGFMVIWLWHLVSPIARFSDGPNQK